MRFSKINFFCACVVGLILLVPVHNAPRSRSKGHSSTRYDQKQSGDYNIQLHLKDFHIVAVLGDDSWGEFGDYEYNYDYSDLTVKPSFPLTTANPQSSNNSSGTSDVDLQNPQTGTEKPNGHPYPIVSPGTTHRPLENSASTATQPHLSTNPAPSDNATTTEKEQLVVNSSEKNVENTEKPTTQKSDLQPTGNPEKLGKPSTEQKVQTPQKSTKFENSSAMTQEPHEKQTESSVANVSVVPSENTGTIQNDQRIPLGEIMHYRKCATGYARDKQGRCRKIRRTPHLPFGITRFATNLASRFRQATSAESSLSETR